MFQIYSYKAAEKEKRETSGPKFCFLLSRTEAEKALCHTRASSTTCGTLSLCARRARIEATALFLPLVVLLRVALLL